MSFALMYATDEFRRRLKAIYERQDQEATMAGKLDSTEAILQAFSLGLLSRKEARQLLGIQPSAEDGGSLTEGMETSESR